MTMKNLRTNIKELYIKQAFEILNFFKSIIIEVHHIGSSTIKNSPFQADLDILFIVKSYDDVKSLSDILIAEGYREVSNYSDYFRDEMVISNKVDGLNINLIFISNSSFKKEEILSCTECISSDNSYSMEFKNLKQSYMKKEISALNYQYKKYRLFQLIKEEDNRLTIV